MVMTPLFTEVSAVVAIAVSAPGRMNAATYMPMDRKMISTMRLTPAPVEARRPANLPFTDSRKFISHSPETHASKEQSMNI